MLSNPEPDHNLEELSDDEIYAAIRYLEAAATGASEQSEDAAATEERDDHGAVICVCLYLAVLGCLATLWLYLK